MVNKRYLKPFRRQAATGALTALLLATSLSACAPAVERAEIPVEPPASFSASGTEVLSGRWWLSFDEPALDELIERALAGNLNLRATWDRLDQARAVARRAGADLLPFLDAEASASRSRFRENGRTGDRSSYGLALVAGYEVDLWGAIRSGRDAAAFDARGSAEDLRAAAITLSAQVAGTWYRLVEEHGQLELLDAQIETNEKVLELITLRFRTGRVGIADVLQQRQLVESKRGEKARAAGRAELLEHQLAILLGVPAGEGAAPGTGELGSLPPLPETGLPAGLIRRRPDVRGAWYALMSADSRVAAAVADRFPRLRLSGALDTSGGHLSDLFDNWLASLAGNLVGPIIDGGGRVAEVDRTRAAASEAFHRYGQSVLDALGEVEDALVLEERRRQYIASLEEQLRLAALTIERLKDRYTRGASDYQRVLDALLSHQQLQRTLLTARRELIQDRIDLHRALGGGWEMDRPGADG